MHDGMQYDPIQGQGHAPFKVGNLAVFKSCLPRHIQRELATDHGLLNYGTLSKLYRAEFRILGPVFVSRDFKVGTKKVTNVICDKSTVSPHTGLILGKIQFKA